MLESYERARQRGAHIHAEIVGFGTNCDGAHVTAPSAEPPTLDLIEAGIGTVIYGTGFHPDFSWIDVPIFDGHGYPRCRRGVTDVPGLYFLGLNWMHTMGSGLFYGVGRDAEYVVTHLCDTQH